MILCLSLSQRCHLHLYLEMLCNLKRRKKEIRNVFPEIEEAVLLLSGHLRLPRPLIPSIVSLHPSWPRRAFPLAWPACFMRDSICISVWSGGALLWRDNSLLTNQGCFSFLISSSLPSLHCLSFSYLFMSISQYLWVSHSAFRRRLNFIYLFFCLLCPCLFLPLLPFTQLCFPFN